MSRELLAFRSDGGSSKTSSKPASTTSLRTDLHGRLLRRALSLTRNRADAEDLLQDTFERALRSPIPTDLGSNATEAWYGRIMFNRFIDQKRHDRDNLFVRGLDLSQHRAAESPTIPSRWRMVSDEDLRASMTRLSPSLRQVLLLKESGRDAESIAAELGIHKTTVSTRLFRARAKLRELASAYCPATDYAA